MKTLIHAFLDCGAPTNPEYGTVTVGHTVFEAIATYSCSPGYSLKGYTKRSCLATGKWSGHTPVCVEGKDLVATCKSCLIEMQRTYSLRYVHTSFVKSVEKS